MSVTFQSERGGTNKTLSPCTVAAIKTKNVLAGEEIRFRALRW
jgi:hypothetical protein